MKKTNIIFSFAVGLGLFFLFSSCDLSIPESVSVKTEATYNFSIGDIEQDFNSSFDKSSLFSGLETEKNKVYDYFPGQKNERLQEFLMTVKIDCFEMPAIPANLSVSIDIPPVDVDLDISAIFSTMSGVFG